MLCFLEDIMAKIRRTSDNIFDIPVGAYRSCGKYVYVNTDNYYVPPDKKKKNPGSRGYTGHHGMSIGVLVTPGDKNCKQFYANSNYFNKYLPAQRQKLSKTNEAKNSCIETSKTIKDLEGTDCVADQSKTSSVVSKSNVPSVELPELPDPPKISNNLSAGLHVVIKNIAQSSGLTQVLSSKFNEKEVDLILSLATYAISEQHMIMQYYPAWARENMINPSSIKNDTFVGKFLRNNLTNSEISTFRNEWALYNLKKDDDLYLFYDSTNTNCQASGVSIVEKRHAKDDPSLDQVNTDYVVRQKDGLPITYLHSPGSVNDLAQAQEMISFFDRLKDLLKERSPKESNVSSDNNQNSPVKMTLVCDRGYISAKNVKLLNAADIDYILMFRSNFNLYKSLANTHIDSLRSYKNAVTYPNQEDLEAYALTIKTPFIEGEKDCYAHIIWNENLYKTKRLAVIKKIDRERQELQELVESEQYINGTELKNLPNYFDLETEEKESNSDNNLQKDNFYKITGFKDNIEKIDKEISKSGVVILLSSRDITAQEAINVYSQRYCVERVFQTLKSHLGMDQFGVSSEEAIHGKGLIWFVASILYSIMFASTAALRKADRKNYTMPCIISSLKAIKIDLDSTYKKYLRRYKTTKVQDNILKAFGITELSVEQAIAEYNEMVIDKNTKE